MRDKKLYKNARIITANKELVNGAIYIEGNKIIAVDEHSAIMPQISTDLSGIEEIDLEGCLVTPGLVDTHIHGFYGYSASAGRVDDILGMSKHLVKFGVTSFLPTIIGGSFQEMSDCIDAVSKAMCSDAIGARPLGIFLEGPYINPQHRGAAPIGRVRMPDLQEFRRLLSVAPNTVRMVIIAPELPGAIDIIHEAVEHGIVVTMGHSNATYEESMDAIAAGATHSCHTFNGMKSFHHRDPGIVGAVLSDNRVYAELTADLIHVHQGAIRLLMQAKGAEKVCLITDSMAPAGLPDGIYHSPVFGDMYKKGISLRLKDNTIAGSAFVLVEAVKNMVNEIGFDRIAAVRMASLIPAFALGITDVGDLAPGKYADFAVFDDSMEIISTVVGGQVVYNRAQSD